MRENACVHVVAEVVRLRAMVRNDRISRIRLPECLTALAQGGAESDRTPNALGMPWTMVAILPIFSILRVRTTMFFTDRVRGAHEE